MATSISWPRPLEERSWSAASVPITANIAASESPRLIPQRAGGRSGSPVVWRIPPIASPIEPNPASSDRGPVWPKPDTWATMIPGLTAESAA